MSFGFWEILVILVIVVLLFGTKKLRNLGTDLGTALRGFKNAVNEDEAKEKKDADFDSVEDKQSHTASEDLTEQHKEKVKE